MKMKYIGAVILLALVLACSLDYENPLDPQNTGIDAPPRVRGLNVVLTWDNKVFITWHPITAQSINGYYLYRSLDEDGFFRRLEGINLQPIDTLYQDTEVNVFDKSYWYKISAYVAVGDTVLEGYRSDPKTWN